MTGTRTPRAKSKTYSEMEITACLKSELPPDHEAKGISDKGFTLAAMIEKAVQCGSPARKPVRLRERRRTIRVMFTSNMISKW